LFTSLKLTIPNEKKSNIIGCELTSFEIVPTPVEVKLITR